MKIDIVEFKDQQFGKKLVDSFSNSGFAIIEGFPMINEDKLNKFYHRIEGLFIDLNSDRDLRNKLLFNKDSQKGYFPFKSEKAKNQSVFDLKEFYHYYYMDLDPTGEAIYDMYNNLMYLSDVIAQQIGSYIGTDLLDMISTDKTLFRVLHYPALESNDDGAVRSAAHEDINLYTLLPAASETGLQVLDREGKWLEVSTNPGQVIVNVGDMPQELTKGELRSTTHRVINGNLAKSRYSAPMFVHPKPETVLSDRYTAESYLEERLKEIGLK